MKPQKIRWLAEEILDPFVKGCLRRDYDKERRNYNTVYISTALKAIRKALRLSPKEVYLVISDKQDYPHAEMYYELHDIFTKREDAEKLRNELNKKYMNSRKGLHDARMVIFPLIY